MKKIAMHCHIKEQNAPIANFFRECIQNDADIVCITDHKSLDAYLKKIPELTKEEIEEFKNLRIMIGLEMTGMYQYKNDAGQTNPIAMDILGYNMDLTKADILDKFVKERYISMDTPEAQKSELARLIEISKQLGFKANYEEMQITEENNLAGRVIAYGLIDPNYLQYNLKQGLLPELETNPRCFFNRYCKNPNSPFFLDMSKTIPPIEDVIDLIKECGGMPFVDHTAAYFAKTGTEEQIRNAWRDSEKFTRDFVSEHKKDLKGIEIIHPAYLRDEKFERILDEVAKENNLYVSGGTDYHKPGERICTDIKDELITDERLPGIEEWAKLYTIEDIIEIAKTKEEKEER